MISGVDGVCGHRVAVQSDTTQADLVAAQANLCRATGRPAQVVLVNAGDTYPLLISGQANALIDGYTSAEEQVKQGGGAYELTGVQVEASPMGIGIAGDRTGLRHAVQLARREVIADGSYTEPLTKYGLNAEALTTAALDGGV